MRLRFYLDEDSADNALIRALRARGSEIVTPEDSGLLGADDTEHLNWCASHEFTLVTHNVGDFYRLHGEFLTQGKSHCGIILNPQQALGIGEKLRRLVKISSEHSAQEMRNHLEFLSNW